MPRVFHALKANNTICDPLNINVSFKFFSYFIKKIILTSGTQKAIPHPLGSSRSHPAPHKFISCPTCLPGWWTSRMGTRPCSGVGLNLEPGTSNSLRMRFNSCRWGNMTGGWDVCGYFQLLEDKSCATQPVLREETCSGILFSVTLSRTDFSHR